MAGLNGNNRRRGRAGPGFTLMEVLVSLVVGTLIVGGVMGVLGASLHYRQRVLDKSADWPVLEAAAQQVLAEPEAYVGGDIPLPDLPGAPVVRAEWTRIELISGGLEQTEDLASRSLYRVDLVYHKSRLHLSLVKGADNGP
ncbi:MAG: hypothetical protein COT06_05880 [Syntrophobacteraceae bacterium CG07_land_8_20_14_0_80_61_8]|nr:MAG: hypothetical protein COT06_05880 [Syntrophobacteraceae bacterium CG07_land_8_20_14_0_80_61_8]